MLLLDLDLTDYQKSLEIQSRIVERKKLHGGDDVLILLEHPPTVTLGKSGTDADLLADRATLERNGLAVYTVERGGRATFHGPGQLVAYPIVALRPLGLRVREYVEKLEETIIATLAHFGVKGFRQKGKVGVWVEEEAKIASIGVRISRGVTSHGFSLNIDLSVDPDEIIVTCGIPRARMVNLNDYVSLNCDMASVKAVVTQCFQREFGVTLTRSSLEEAVKREPA